MKKRMITIGLAISMIAALLVGCGNGEISNDKITIKQYKGLEVKKEKVAEVTDAVVEESIKTTLQSMATQTEIKDRAAQNGDIVLIDYEGKLDGVAFEGGTATDYNLELGSDSFIDGFEDGIIGHKIGETFDLELTFPENYHSADMAGKTVVFTVTLDAITEVTLPELTDDLVKEISDTSTTVEEYKTQVKEDLITSNEETAAYALEQKVWAALVENCEVTEYPQEQVDQYVASLTSQYEYYAAMYGMETEDFIVQYYGVSSERIAKDNICKEYAIELIAEKEKIVITAEDYEKGLAEYAAQYGYDDVEEFEKLIGEESIKKELLAGRVGEFLVENCKQVESK